MNNPSSVVVRLHPASSVRREGPQVSEAPGFSEAIVPSPNPKSVWIPMLPEGRLQAWQFSLGRRSQPEIIESLKGKKYCIETSVANSVRVRGRRRSVIGLVSTPLAFNAKDPPSQANLLDPAYLEEWSSKHLEEHLIQLLPENAILELFDFSEIPLGDSFIFATPAMQNAAGAKFLCQVKNQRREMWLSPHVAPEGVLVGLSQKFMHQLVRRPPKRRRKSGSRKRAPSL